MAATKGQMLSFISERGGEGIGFILHPYGWSTRTQQMASEGIDFILHPIGGLDEVAIGGLDELAICGGKNFSIHCMHCIDN